MNQDQLKALVARAAAEYVEEHSPRGSIIGVGTGSTANLFIDELGRIKDRFSGAVASSEASRERLEKLGFRVFDLNDVTEIPIYVDGADEVDPGLSAIKGGGAALTREKIVAAVAGVFVCIADASKRVPVLGAFPLPIEVVPMARTAIGRRVTALGGVPVLRVTQDGAPYITDNGNEIIDVKGLQITDPRALEAQINGWPGVVTVGLFAVRGADLCLLGTADGVETIVYPPRG